mmetsp:Transcript_117849/g.334137  ORF Transcript_117849/g.334137 Transcript_117849/m.334137 type:complete len:645 (-) Transcript_117849:84-2018(-)
MRASRSAGQLIVGGTLTERPGSAGYNATSSLTRLEQAKSPYQLGLKSLRKFEFGHAAPGGHGLSWEDTIVTSAQGQARKLGVIPGWKIHMVDGHQVGSSEDVWIRLQDAKWQWRSCTVWFVTDLKSIRAEQAQQRARRMVEDEQRLARLPFEGTQDLTHLQQVRGHFKFQGYIDRVEDRSIALDQLKQVVHWASLHCHRWRDKATRQKLHIDNICFHHINDWLIKPATKQKDSAFTEMLTAQKQPPAWFVIHWWGEKVVDFMNCLELHTATRQLPGTTAYWIGAFANRQHSFQDDLSEDLRKTAYFKAMQAAKFHAIMTLEPKVEQTKDGVVHVQGPASSFSRCWCNIEACMCCYDLPVGVDPILDLAATHASKAVLITGGLTEKEEALERSDPGAGYRSKMEREKGFGVDVIRAGLSISIEGGQTTDPKDRTRILNAIAKRDPALPPIEDHELYLKVNRRLSALIAMTVWRRVMAGSSEYSLQVMLADALKHDIWDDTLELSLAYCVGVTERMPFVMRSLHQHLLHLTLDFKGMGLDDGIMKDLAAGLPPDLEELHIDLSQNPEITNVGIANFEKNLPLKLKSVSVRLAGTGTAKEFQDKSDTLEGIRKAIFDEAQKGNLCTTVNLNPSPNRRMAFQTERSKV